MESFIYAHLNNAARDHDTSKIFTLGPLAYCLGIIIASAENSKNTKNENHELMPSIDSDNYVPLYRGLKLPKSSINDYKK